MGIAHWDEVDKARREQGPMGASWSRLGDAAGSRTVGANRIEIDPGKLATPPHLHSASEEIFYVLGGSGLAWLDGRSHPLGAGDCLVCTAGGFEHTLRGGSDGLDVIAFGTRPETELGWLPRSRALRFGWQWVEGREDDPWLREAEIGELEFPDPQPDPPSALVRSGDLDGGRRDLGRAAGSETTGLRWCRLEPGAPGAPAHCHGAEEEIFVILEGRATLELIPSPVALTRGTAEERHELRAGHVVSRLAGTGVAHAFRAGSEGCTYLAYGTREPNELVYYPRSNKVFFTGLGLIARLEPRDFWDGERRD